MSASDRVTLEDLYGEETAQWMRLTPQERLTTIPATSDFEPQGTQGSQRLVSAWLRRGNLFQQKPRL